ncbi:hemerythrin domain-containing protein [Microbispora sp. NPDC046973]|uniref:hemerythrin domain-containing protein n=1 Tax=Microbispora sp. NPDC046973 TaxID=3155022 RepID=UPI0033FD09D7
MRRRSPVLTEVREAPARQERKKATRVLVEHHELLRAMMRRLSEIPRSQPGRRRALADELFDELWIHERIEENIFYPAVRHITPGTAAAWSEHRQLTDQLAALTCADPRTERFDRELGVLHDVLESHAHLDEELQMFPEIERFADEELLAELGDRLQARQGRLRSSRRVRRFLRLERALLRRTAR